jgi:LacI family transcriptional regulator
MGDAARSRIQAAMADLHFTPSALTRAIRRRRTKILGIMMFDLSSLDQNVGTAVAPQMLAGVNTEAFEAAHNILLYTGLQYRPQYQAGAEFLDGHIDGLIWVAREMKEPILERVAAAGLPTVALLTRHVPAGIGFIDAENVAGSRAMVRHLAGRGHRRIAYAGSVHSSNVIDRLEGYRQGLRDSGLPYDPALESADNALRSSADAYARALDRWLALPEPPTAIMLQNDRAAAMLLPAIQARGLRVPEDIAVAGFDDAPDAQWLGGGLTTQRQPFAQMGRLAVKNLIALIEDAPAEACRLIIPTELVIRASTGGA